MTIAFVNSANIGNAVSTSISGSYTAGSAANTALILCLGGDANRANDDLTSVTYAGSAMTLVTKLLNFNCSTYGYIYYLLSPTSGSNTLSVTCTSSHWLNPVILEYSGVSQTSPIDVSGTNASAQGANSVGATLTSTVNNDFMIFYGIPVGNVPSISGGTLRQQGFSGYSYCCDTGPITPAGATSMTMTGLANDSWAYGVVAAMIEPAPAAVTYVPPRPIIRPVVRTYYTR